MLITLSAISFISLLATAIMAVAYFRSRSSNDGPAHALSLVSEQIISNDYTHRAEVPHDSNLALVAKAMNSMLDQHENVKINLRQIIQVTKYINNGDYSFRLEIPQIKELAIIAQSFNSLLDYTESLIQLSEERNKTQSSIRKLLEDISGVAEGDLTQQAEVTADITGAIADSFNYMIFELRRVIGNVQGATQKLNTSADDVKDTIKGLNDGAEMQSGSIIDITSAIDEMAFSVKQVSEDSELSASVAEEALNNAKMGNEAVSKTIEGMNNIRERVQETSKRIKRLGESSQEIGEIVQLIGDIADRTSILAMNASIQAAMAGDAGRGFQVVAEEVERLAERATESTKRIETLIKTIQTETNEAVAAMEETTRGVVDGSEVANDAGMALERIEEVSTKLSELIRSITMESKQQARGSEAIAQAMLEISQVTHTTASGTHQAAVSVENLTDLAEQLRESVSTFRLPETSEIMSIESGASEDDGKLAVVEELDVESIVREENLRV